MSRAAFTVEKRGKGSSKTTNNNSNKILLLLTLIFYRKKYDSNDRMEYYWNEPKHWQNCHPPKWRRYNKKLNSKQKVVDKNHLHFNNGNNHEYHFYG